MKRSVNKIFVALFVVALLLQSAVFVTLAEEGVAKENSKPANSATSTPGTSGQTRDELAAQIQEKTRQLEEIDGQLASTKKDLEQAQNERRTLQREISVLQGTISQLDLNIKADQTRIQKLNLEIDALGYDIHNISSSIKNRKDAIAKVMIELQRNDYLEKNMMVLFLRSGSLAEGFLLAQSLKNLQNQLTVDVANLIDLHKEYNDKIVDANVKKNDLAYHQINLENRRLILDDKKWEQQTILSQTKNKEGVFRDQVDELEKLKKDIANEVEALGAILRTKIDPATLPPLGPGVLEMPIKTTKENITQDYGSTDFAQYGYRGKWHNGVDLRAPIGTPVLATEEGEITAIGDQDKYCYRGAYGRFIVINHSNNLTSMYAHLSRIIVNEGQKVKRGEVIGYSGNSGYATGPHLHFTVFAQPTFYMGPSKVCGPMPFGGDLNPAGYL